MDLFFYCIVFIIGIVFGSFYTLAIYRIPKKQDITHTRSFCPNCNHKLGFLDLIPIFSYIFLKGKCRYCKEKIRPRYLIIEIISGILFVAIAFLMQLKLETLNINQVVQYGFMVLYISYIIIVSGIDKENRKIEKSVSICGIVISIVYILYLYIIEHASIYRYGIYLLFYIIVLALDTFTLKRYAKDSYATGILFVVITMAIFTGELISITTIIHTLLVIFIYLLIYKIKSILKTRKREKMEMAKQLNIAFYLGVSNIIWVVWALLCNYYRL